MMYYIRSNSTDPYYNLALEQYVFDNMDRRHGYFMLWQNHNAVIVGKYQNTVEEINQTFVREQEISVVRRLSGGGAVYHDLGNLNFTFITDQQQEDFDFASFCRPVAKVLASLGAPVEISGRNDITIHGKKFSGNSQYTKSGRIMHHGTLMFDSDLSILSQALRVSEDKIVSKGIQSVRSRVDNIRPHITQELSTIKFWEVLEDNMLKEYQMEQRYITPQEEAAVQQLSDRVYRTWEWNYGTSPAYAIKKQRRIDGCGKIEVHMDVGKQGVIENIAFYGDFFAKVSPQELSEKLKGCRLEEKSLGAVLNTISVENYFNNMKDDDFIALLMK